MGFEQPHPFNNLRESAETASMEVNVTDLHAGDFSISHKELITRVQPGATQVGIELERSGMIYLDRDESLEITRG